MPTKRRTIKKNVSSSSRGQTKKRKRLSFESKKIQVLSNNGFSWVNVKATRSREMAELEKAA